MEKIVGASSAGLEKCLNPDSLYEFFLLRYIYISVTKSAVPMCQPTCCFTSRQMFNTNRKDVLPAEKICNIIYFFTCNCDHRYVGKTTQRLEERVKQHVPGDLVQQVTQSASTLRRRLGRPRKNVGERDRDVETMASARGDTAITKHLKAMSAASV